MNTTTQEPKTVTIDQETPRQVIGRFLPGANGTTPHTPSDERTSSPVAVFCFEPTESFIGGHVAKVVSALAMRGQRVHLFCRTPLTLEAGCASKVKMHAVGPASEEGDLLERVQEFKTKASNAFMQAFRGSEPVAIIGFEWTSAPVLGLLKGLQNLSGVLSLHSLERQRSDLSSDMSRKIVELEYDGIQASSRILVHDQATADALRQWLPTCQERVTMTRDLFPMADFERQVDPGAIKARYEVGPVDPVLLYVGDLDERYGPELLVKAMPAILRHHPQARLVIVGDGPAFWPMRVFARYLLLEHAVRLVGDVRGDAMAELVAASDIIVVPSRESTPWWPIQAAWAARKPVVATHEAARGLTEHEKDSVLIYPSENSIVWGVERVLYDEGLRKAIGEAGRRKLEERFGWNTLAEQVEEVLMASVAK